MESLFSRLKMNDTRDVLGAKMSTGMKQKVSVARAVVHDPPVLIFDEATAGLDVLVARALLNTVAELRDHGKCVIFSTHIMREAEKLCDRVAILHRGCILAEGTLEDLRDRHGQWDLEELFFQLISQHDEAAACGSQPNMTFSNVKLILAREVRDQLRDRRTLFIIAVLPVVLYPLLGMSLFQIAQFTQEQKARVLVVGAGKLAALAAAVREGALRGVALLGREGGRVARLALRPPRAKRRPVGGRSSGRRPCPGATGRLRGGALLPARFCRPARRLPQGHRRAAGGKRPATAVAGQAAPLPRDRSRGALAQVPSPEIIYSTASDKSQLACVRLAEVLRRWTQRIGEENLELSGVPKGAVQPFSVGAADVASPPPPRGGDVVQNPPRAAVALGPDRGLLSGHRPLRRREGTRHAGDALEQPRRAERDRAGQADYDHALQRDHRRVEPGERRADRLGDLGAAAGVRPAAGGGDHRPGRRPAADGGPVQRPLPGVGGLRPQHQGRPILPHAAAVCDHAAGDPADVAGRAIEPGQQPDPGDRSRAAAAEHVGGGLLAGACSSRRWWPA